MNSITADYLRDMAKIQHARSCGETPLQDTPAWQAAERIEELERQLESKESEIRALSGPRRMSLHNDDGETYRAPVDGWTCFHCGELLETEHEARAHFGDDPQATPACRESKVRADAAEARLDRLTGAVQQARLYAGDNLPAGPGCTVVHMLEQALKEGAA